MVRAGILPPFEWLSRVMYQQIAVVAVLGQAEDVAGADVFWLLGTQRAAVQLGAVGRAEINSGRVPIKSMIVTCTLSLTS